MYFDILIKTIHGLPSGLMKITKIGISDSAQIL